MAFIGHETRLLCDRSFFFNKILELDFHVGFIGMKVPADFLKNFTGFIYPVDVTVIIENLYETAHMSSTEMVRQVHIHIHHSNSILLAVLFIQNRNGPAKPLDSHPVERDFPVIRERLYIGKIIIGQLYVPYRFLSRYQIHIAVYETSYCFLFKGLSNKRTIFYYRVREKDFFTALLK